MNTSKPQRIAYGDDVSQFGTLHRPSGEPRGVVVVIHGGFWSADYGLDLGEPLARDLADKGWIAWNLEYRRIENGGGWPTTFDDIGAGIDHLAAIENIPTDTVVTLGHSAGGHLGVWAAGRTEPKVRVTVAVSQAGVLDFDAAVREHLGSDAVQRFVGKGDARRLADPLRQIPLPIPVHCLHAPDDDRVPMSQSVSYVAAATAAGAKAELIEVEGGHFGHIDTSSQAWARTIELFETL